MSEAKRMLEERLEREETTCEYCQGKTATMSCVRCGEDFQQCVVCETPSQCDYCEHMTTKDD